MGSRVPVRRAYAGLIGHPEDLSSYWAPTLYVAGVPVRPLGVAIYYRRLTTAAVQPFPRGLEMVAGNSHAVTAQSPSVTEWYCGVLKSAFYGPMRRATASAFRGLPRCAAPTNLELQVNFPNCADGKPTSTDHRSHMAYSSGGRCPASHPIPVPAVSLILRYPAETSANVFLSSGGAYSGHADFMDGWKAGPFRRLVQSCLNHYSGCGPQATGALDTPLVAFIGRKMSCIRVVKVRGAREYIGTSWETPPGTQPTRGFDHDVLDKETAPEAHGSAALAARGRGRHPGGHRGRTAVQLGTDDLGPGA